MLLTPQAPPPMLDRLCRLLTDNDPAIRQQGRELLCALPGVDLSDCTLDGADLRGVDLRGVRMHRVSLTDAELRQIDLRQADLTDADLSSADLSGATLSRAALPGASLSSAVLAGADLYRANLSGANLSGVHLIGADLRDADLSGADLRRATLHRARLDGADLTGARLDCADLRQATLAGAVLTEAIGDDGTLPTLPGLLLVHPDADLSGADLSGLMLSDLRLDGASLRGADLSGARLVQVDLSFADLTGADLSGARLEGCDLTGATLAGADLSDLTRIDTPLPLPLSHDRIHGPPQSVAALMLQGSRSSSEQVRGAACYALSSLGMHEAVLEILLQEEVTSSSSTHRMFQFGALLQCPLPMLEARLPEEHTLRPMLLSMARMQRLTEPEALAEALVAASDLPALRERDGFSADLRAQTARILLLQTPLPAEALLALPGALSDEIWQDPELLAVFCRHGDKRPVSVTWRARTGARSHPAGVLPLLTDKHQRALLEAAAKGLPRGPVLASALLDARHSAHVRGQILRLMSSPERSLLRPHLTDLITAVPTLLPVFRPDELPAEALPALLDVMLSHSRFSVRWLISLARDDPGYRQTILSRALAGMSQPDPGAEYQLLRMLQYAGVPVPPFPEPGVLPRRPHGHYSVTPPAPARVLLARLRSLGKRGGSVPSGVHEAPEAAELVLAALRSASPAARRRAAKWASQLPADEALNEALIGCLADPDRQVQREACEALRGCGTEAAIPHLCRAAVDTRLRRVAVHAISHILQRRPIEP